MCKNNFDEKEVRESITNGLVDEVNTGTEDFEGLLLARVARLVLLDDIECVRREDDSSVAVGFEIDTNIELLCSVVQVLDTRGRTVNLEFEGLLNVLSSSTVSVGSLDNTNLDLLCESTLAYRITKERSYERSDAVSVEKTEDIL